MNRRGRVKQKNQNHPDDWDGKTVETLPGRAVRWDWEGRMTDGELTAKQSCWHTPIRTIFSHILRDKDNSNSPNHQYYLECSITGGEQVYIKETLP